MTDPALRKLLDGVANYYGDKLKQHGPGAQGMDWKDAESQALRFDVLCRQVDWSDNPSLLDVGCGDGQLAHHLAAQGHSVRYTGIDLSSAMVEAARARLPEGDFRVSLAQELLANGERFDYVLASGTFNVKGQTTELQWRDYMHASVRIMFELCERATAFNVMTSFVDYRYERLHYASAQELADLAIACGTRRFILDHDYPLYEVTATLFRR